MIDEPVPTMPEMVPARRPTMRTKRKPITYPVVSPHPEEPRSGVSKDEGPVWPHGSRRRKRLLTMRGRTADAMLCRLLTAGWQQGRTMKTAAPPHLERDHHATEGKLPLRQDAIRGHGSAGRRDALHLLAVLQARRAVGLLHAGAVSPDVAGRKRRDLSVAHQDRQTQFLRRLRLRHLLGIAGLVERQGRLREAEDRRQCAAVRRLRSRCRAGDGDRRQESVGTGACIQKGANSWA